MKKKSLGYYLIVLILGSVVGYFLGQLANFIPNATTSSLLTTPLKYSLGPGLLDLRMISITLGFSINVNIASVLGVIVVAYMLRWME